MRERPFGRTGWLVSEIGFGSWAIGSAWGSVKDEESLDALRVSLDNGVDFLDTADVYGDDHKSERLIAGILKERRKQGKALPIVATKLGRRLPKQDAAQFTYANLATFVEASLKRSRSMCSPLRNCAVRRSKPTTARKSLQRWIAFSEKAKFVIVA